MRRAAVHAVEQLHSEPSAGAPGVLADKLMDMLLTANGQEVPFFLTIHPSPDFYCVCFVSSHCWMRCRKRKHI